MNLKDSLHAEWEVMAPKWIERIRGTGDPSRLWLLDPWMLDAGDVRGRDVSDLGCGEGRSAVCSPSAAHASWEPSIRNNDPCGR